jgi:hypothetical protein
MSYFYNKTNMFGALWQEVFNYSLFYVDNRGLLIAISLYFYIYFKIEINNKRKMENRYLSIISSNRKEYCKENLDNMEVIKCVYSRMTKENDEIKKELDNKVLLDECIKDYSVIYQNLDNIGELKYLYDRMYQENDSVSWGKRWNNR